MTVTSVTQVLPHRGCRTRDTNLVTGLKEAVDRILGSFAPFPRLGYFKHDAVLTAALTQRIFRVFDP